MEPMTDAALADLSDTNCFETFRALSTASGMAVLEDGALLCVTTGAPVAFLNVGFVRRPLDDPEAGLARAVAFFDGQRLPFVIRIREGLDAEAERAAERLGLPYTDTVPGMTLHPVPEPPPPPAGLRITRVSDDAELNVFQEAMSAGFGMPIDIARRLMTRRTIGTDGLECYVGRVDGATVGVSSLFRIGRTAGVYNVAILPAFRGRGFGAAMTWHPVARGRAAGCDVAVLQASKMGLPVYARMGFRVVAPYRTFHRVSK